MDVDSSRALTRTMAWGTSLTCFSSRADLWPASWGWRGLTSWKLTFPRRDVGAVRFDRADFLAQVRRRFKGQLPMPKIGYASTSHTQPTHSPNRARHTDTCIQLWIQQENPPSPPVRPQRTSRPQSRRPRAPPHAFGEIRRCYRSWCQLEEEDRDIGQGKGVGSQVSRGIILGEGSVLISRVLGSPTLRPS